MGWLNDREYSEQLTKIQDAVMTQIEIKVVGRHAESVSKPYSPPASPVMDSTEDIQSSIYKDTKFLIF